MLKDVIEDTLCEAEVPEIEYPAVIMLVGVNGVGKTTTIGKLANYFVKEKKSVTVAAADTFRAAAADQLSVWADRAKVRIVKHEEGSDPSAVVFDAVSSAKAKKTDVVIVDTAGRLHVKANLMEELKKMDRVVSRDYPEAHFYKFLVLDATTGQNALSQARLFDEAVDLDGIVLDQAGRDGQGRVRRVAVRRAENPRGVRRHGRKDRRSAAVRRGRVHRGHYLIIDRSAERAWDLIRGGDLLQRQPGSHPKAGRQVRPHGMINAQVRAKIRQACPISL